MYTLYLAKAQWGVGCHIVQSGSPRSPQSRLELLRRPNSERHSLRRMTCESSQVVPVATISAPFRLARRNESHVARGRIGAPVRSKRLQSVLLGHEQFPTSRDCHGQQAMRPSKPLINPTCRIPCCKAINHLTVSLLTPRTRPGGLKSSAKAMRRPASHRNMFIPSPSAAKSLRSSSMTDTTATAWQPVCQLGAATFRRVVRVGSVLLICLGISVCDQ